jgi:hypothetical protein
MAAKGLTDDVDAHLAAEPIPELHLERRTARTRGVRAVTLGTI